MPLWLFMQIWPCLHQATMSWNSSTMAAPVCCRSRPPILNPHSTAEISPNCTLTEDLAGDISSTSLHAGNNPPFSTHHPAECGESLFIEAGPLSESMQQPEAAKVSTNLIFETWAPELSHDPDMEFILSRVVKKFLSRWR